jgi:hypothetical protein
VADRGEAWYPKSAASGPRCFVRLLLGSRRVVVLFGNGVGIATNDYFADNPGVIGPSTRQEKSGHPGGVYWIRVRHPLLHLLFYKVVENNVAGNCVDGLDLPPLTEDHKIQVRIRGRDESTRAVRIYGVGARNIHWRD